MFHIILIIPSLQYITIAEFTSGCVHPDRSRVFARANEYRCLVF